MGSTTLTNGSGSRYLDSNNKLSSAGAAASLKYARPQDLPSYPSVGLPPNRQNRDAHAGAAANLGWANQKPVEIWKPDPTTSASTAATIGWTRRSNPSWQPQQSASGARAAVLAAKSDLRVADQKAVPPRPKSAGFGNSAANVAMQKDRRSLQALPTPDRASQLNRRRSLMAATGAMASPRPRADSTPPLGPKYPDEMNARANALRAATHADTVSRRRRFEIPQGGATPVTNMGKERYTSHPPQPSEADQKQKEDSMHASAVAMAQQMYKIIEKREKETGEAGYAATAAHGRGRSTSLMGNEPTPMKYGNLQEAAQRLAQERLAKLHDENFKNREYLEYYGTPQPSQRLSKGRFRRRASSDISLEESRDRRGNVRFQAAAPLYSSDMSQIDAKTRQRDRDMLLAAAQRNVQRSLQGIDERVYAQTGRPTPSMMGQETLPMAIAQQRVQQQQVPQQRGDKVSIGNGALVDRSSVDALAFRNVQPVLHQINTKSDAEQARRTEIKLDEEEAKRRIERERERDQELKEIDKQLKEHDKHEKKERKSQETFFKRQSKRWSRQSNKTKSTQSRDSYVQEPMAMSGAVGGGGGVSEYDRVATAEYEPPVGRYEPPVERYEPLVERVEPTYVEPAPAVQPVQQAPITPPTQHVRVAEPVKPVEPAPPTLAVQPPEPIEEEDVPEIPVSEYTDKGKSSLPFTRLQKSTRPSQTSTTSQQGVKSWLKTAFRRTSKGQKEEQEKQNGSSGLFVGGASLAQQPDGTPTQVASKAMYGDENGKPTQVASKAMYGDENEVPVSKFLTGTDGSKYSQEQEGSAAGGGLASYPAKETAAPREEWHESEEARDQFNDADVAMPIFESSRPLSPARDSRFKEVI
ncbi:hypothetical protein VE01_07164 [Pseudogymnoascus verrucosus]|uniref:Eisosome protein 1 n=1 Tax=Pseudogymnoascus verrucosus TaxID=342668 RepID=A0A1B8GE32_9PEZI|nr:uncharacterized protein VE01_07164 [Pseudogymnoascus verrucosus]OBT94088.1 hypothetical protein VE01_07164 [Pseudogymnoascus verrucosus]